MNRSCVRGLCQSMYIISVATTFSHVITIHWMSRYYNVIGGCMEILLIKTSPWHTQGHRTPQLSVSCSDVYEILLSLERVRIVSLRNGSTEYLSQLEYYLRILYIKLVNQMFRYILLVFTWINHGHEIQVYYQSNKKHQEHLKKNSYINDMLNVVCNVF